MKIVHVVDYFHPELGYQETFVAREHARMGHEVCVVTSDRYSPFIYKENRNLLGKRIKKPGMFMERDINVWRLKTRWEIPHAIWVSGLESKLRELKPDVVMVHGIANFFAIRIARLKKKTGGFKLIYDDHMAFAASRSPMRLLYPLFRLFCSPQIQKSADALVAVAETCRRFMRARYGIPAERIVTVPLGADAEVFKFDVAVRNEVRNRLGIGSDETVFIYAGKIVAVKGPHLLVDAALQLAKTHGNIRVLLVGNGSSTYIGEMKAKIQAQGATDLFIWHDAVLNRELPGFYSAADVAVWPREASLSMMEAMACNLPVIISDTSEVAERVAYNNGLTYRGDDAADLAQKMQQLLKPELRKEMGQQGRKLIEDKLSWRVIARQFLDLVQ